MNKNLIFPLVIVFCCGISLHFVRADINHYLMRAIQQNDEKFLDEILHEIKYEKDPVDVTDALNVVAKHWQKNGSAIRTLKSSFIPALGIFSCYLFWKFRNLKHWGCGVDSHKSYSTCGTKQQFDECLAQENEDLRHDTKDDAEYSIVDKDGNKKTVSKDEFNLFVKYPLLKNAIVAGGIWGLVASYKIWKNNRHYKGLMQKILSTPHIKYKSSKLTSGARNLMPDM